MYITCCKTAARNFVNALCVSDLCLLVQPGRYDLCPIRYGLWYSLSPNSGTMLIRWSKMSDCCFSYNAQSFSRVKK